MTTSPRRTAFRAARDQLLAWRGRHEEAVAGFRWPELGGGSTGPSTGSTPSPAATTGRRWSSSRRTATGEPTVSRFDEMARARTRSRAGLPAQGVGKGDRSSSCSATRSSSGRRCSAIMKLGAVIMPTTTAAGPADLTDRIARGRRALRHRQRSGCRRSSTTSPGDVHGRVSVGARRTDGWADLHAAYEVDVEPDRASGDRADDPLLLYFTSGTTSRAEARRAHPGLLPGRAPVDDVLARAAARRRAPQHLVARLGQARLVAASSRRGSPRRRSSSTTTPGSTRRRCCDQLRETR